jgi:hypothetical protein
MICRAAKRDGYIGKTPLSLSKLSTKAPSRRADRSQLPKFRGLFPLQTLNGKA